MRKLNVGVFMGGRGAEREVSLNSGRTICDHLDTQCYTIIPIFQSKLGTLYILPWRFLHRGKISDFEHRLEAEAEKISWESLKARVDFLYLAVHGRYAEDGTLQGLLEVLNIPYLGSKVFASALGMNKYLQKIILRAHCIEVPRSITLENIDTLSLDEVCAQLKERNIDFPLVVKPIHEGSSIGISVIQEKKQLLTAVKAASYCSDTQQAVLIEEFIEGMEFTCIIITDKNQQKLPLPVTEIIPEKHSLMLDYEQKYMPGRALKFTPARCSLEQQKLIQQTCTQVMAILGFSNLARIDGFLTKDNRVVIVDPNTLSGMAPASYIFNQAAELNMSHTQLINHLIETELHTYGIDHALSTSNTTIPMHTAAKLRVAVLMGGRSNEKEISLESGRNIVYKLSPHKYEIVPIFVDTKLELYKLDQRLLVRNSTHEIVHELQFEQKIAWSSLSELVDFAFIALHGGEGEDGTVQGALEMLNIPYNGSGVLTSGLCMDKFKTKQVLQALGFDVPQGILISAQTWAAQKKILLPSQFPLIVKPHDDGCSVFVYKVRTEQELHTALDTMFAAGKTHALIEECIVGMELTVGVIGNDKPQALPPSRAVASGDVLSITEKFLPGAGENQTPAPLPAESLRFVQETMEKIYAALGCKGYARIDCFYQSAEQNPTGKERIVTLEVNTLPGMTPATCIFHQAAEIGLKAMDFVDLIVQLGLELHKNKTHIKIIEKESRLEI